MARKHGITFAQRVVSDADQIKELAEDRTEFKDRDVVENTETKLQFRRWPYEEWIGGSILVLMSVGLILFLKYEMVDEKERTWTQIFWISLLAILGQLFIYQGVVKTVVFEKENDSAFDGETNDGTMTIITTDVLLRKTYECYALSDIDYVEGAKRGVQSKTLDTVHYVLQVGIYGIYKPVKILDSKNELRIKKSLLAVRDFLNLDLDKPLEIKDQCGEQTKLSRKEQFKQDRKQKLIPSKILEKANADLKPAKPTNKSEKN